MWWQQLQGVLGRGVFEMDEEGEIDWWVEKWWSVVAFHHV